MMNFINSIPTNIGWMLVGAVAAILLCFLIDVIRMAVIAIKGRREEDEDKSPCPLCGESVEPLEEEETYCIYKCPICGTQWREWR